MPVQLSAAPRKNWMVGLNRDNGAGQRESVSSGLVLVNTAAGNYDVYHMAPEDGYLHSADFSAIDALVASDTNYVTFSLVNLGQDGLGSTEMLVNDNTKVTGGSALAANSKRSLKTSPTSNNLKVKAGDRLRFRAVVTGTLPNSLNGGVLLLRFV